MEYYYVENGVQFGPFSIEELKLKPLKESTLIWHDGLEDWTEAKKVEELKSYFVNKTPPRIPKAKQTTPPSPNFSQSSHANVKKEESSKIGSVENQKMKERFPLFLILGIIMVVGIIYFLSTFSFSNQPIQNSSPEDSPSLTSEEPPASEMPIEVPDEPTEEDLKGDLYQEEVRNPLKHLIVTGDVRENLALNTVIEGSIYNAATLASFKNVKIRVQYFSKTDVLLSTDNLTIMEFFYAGKSVKFKEKLYGLMPKGTSYTRLDIISAEPN